MAGAVYYFFGSKPRANRSSRSTGNWPSQPIRPQPRPRCDRRNLGHANRDFRRSRGRPGRDCARRGGARRSGSRFERDREHAPAAAGAARTAARGGPVPPPAAAFVERDRDRSPHLLPRHRDHCARRRLDRVVSQPGRRMRHVGGLSRFAGGACDLRQRSARGSGLGARAEGQGGRVRRRLSGHRRVVLCLGRPPCDLARCPLSDLPGRRLAEIGC